MGLCIIAIFCQPPPTLGSLRLVLGDHLMTMAVHINLPRSLWCGDAGSARPTKAS